MARRHIFDSVEPYRQSELDDFSRMYDIAKSLNSTASRERVRLFVSLLEELKLDEHQLDAFVADPGAFIEAHPRYAGILNAATLNRLDDVRSSAGTSDSSGVLPRNLEPLRRSIFAALTENHLFKKAALASVCLSIVFASIVAPAVQNSGGARMNVYGREPASIALVRASNSASRLVLPCKGAAEQQTFLRASALSKLARDIYENPEVARLFRENPEAYLERIGLPVGILDPNDYEVKFALFLGTDIVHDLVRRKDAKGFAALAAGYIAASASGGQPAKPEVCTAVALCIALVGGYTGVVLANWIAGAVSLVAYLGLYAWTYISGPSGGCFLADTPVTVGPGRYRRIQELRAGDKVASYNEFDRALEYSPVQALHCGRSDHYFMMNETIKATALHPFLVGDRWRKMQDITVGDALRSISGDSVPVCSLERIDRPVDIFNLTVDKNHNFFVCDVLSHNKSAPIAPGSEVAGGSYTSMLRPREQFAVECARRAGGDTFSAEVFLEIYRQYIEEAKRTATGGEQRRLVRQLDRWLKESGEPTQTVS